jgi:hypothetical protein
MRLPWSGRAAVSIESCMSSVRTKIGKNETGTGTRVTPETVITWVRNINGQVKIGNAAVRAGAWRDPIRGGKDAARVTFARAIEILGGVIINGGKLEPIVPDNLSGERMTGEDDIITRNVERMLKLLKRVQRGHASSEFLLVGLMILGHGRVLRDRWGRIGLHRGVLRPVIRDRGKLLQSLGPGMHVSVSGELAVGVEWSVARHRGSVGIVPGRAVTARARTLKDGRVCSDTTVFGRAAVTVRVTSGT